MIQISKWLKQNIKIDCDKTSVVVLFSSFRNRVLFTSTIRQGFDFAALRGMKIPINRSDHQGPWPPSWSEISKLIKLDDEIARRDEVSSVGISQS